MLQKNKNILMVIAPIGFQDIEYGHSREEFEKAGINIKVASLENGIAKGAFGKEVKIDLLVNEADPQQFDAVVFIGGGGMVDLVDNEDLQKLAQKFASVKKLTTAICIAPVILANAGLLDQKRATVHESGEEKFKNKGLDYTGEPVTIDNNIITANGPGSAQDFGKAIVEKLNAQDT